jgi:NAD(P)-dependent dehydrogenase (short-subunit alcohol dehydrogenase family)
MMRLKDRVALITGGGRGIGRAIAERLAGEGAAVMLASLTESELQATAEAIQQSGGRAAFLAGDISEEAFVTRLVEETRRELGEIDILVNNAGIYSAVAALHEVSLEEWDRVIKVNLRAPFLLLRAVLPAMVERGRGVVLNIASISGKAAFPWSNAYGVSKAALIQLSRTAAAEVARSGVRVNALCPGPVLGTRMQQELRRELGKRLNVTDERVAEQIDGSLLQGRPQRPEEVAAAALFLCSDDASAITGQAVNVDGGAVFY